MAAVIIFSDFGAQENKVCHCFHCFPSNCREVMGLDAMVLVFWMLSFKPAYSLSSFVKRLLSSSLLSAIRMASSIVDMKVKLLSCVWLFATPWTVAYQASLSMGFSRQEYCSGLLFPSPGDLPNPGIEPWSPALQADSLPAEPPGKRVYIYNIIRKQVEFKWRLPFFSVRISISFP